MNVSRQFRRSFSVTSGRLKNESSTSWLQKHVSDEFVKRSRYENYRARSAFKLIQIDEKYNIIRPGNLVIDLGASPGSWSQVAARIMRLNNEPSKLPVKKWVFLFGLFCNQLLADQPPTNLLTWTI